MESLLVLSSMCDVTSRFAESVKVELRGGVNDKELLFEGISDESSITISQGVSLDPKMSSRSSKCGNIFNNISVNTSLVYRVAVLLTQSYL